MGNSDKNDCVSVFHDILSSLEKQWANIKEPTPIQQFGYDLLKGNLTTLDVFVSKQVAVQHQGGKSVRPVDVVRRMNSVFAELLGVMSIVCVSEKSLATDAYVELVGDLIQACGSRAAMSQEGNPVRIVVVGMPEDDDPVDL